MKKIILSLTVLSTALSLNAQVVFEAQTSGTTQDLEAIDIRQISSSVYQLWTSGTGGTILQSPDLGENWAPQTSGVTATLNDITFITSTDGWAVGSTGTIISTQNGGDSWGIQSQGAPVNINTVYFHNIFNGIALGEQAIAITTTSGNTWSPATTTYNINSVDFISNLTGYACGQGGTIIKTQDGGNNWFALTSGTTASLEDIYFISDTEGWASGYSGVILHTTDSGATWTLQPNALTSVVAAVKFFDEQHGWACGYSGVIFQTRDGGTTWTAHTSGFTGTSLYLRDLVLLSATEGIAVGENGTIVHFKDNTDYTGIEEISELNSLLYPNPATSTLNIETDEIIQSVSIFNLSGTLVQKETTKSFSVEALPAGVYTVSLISEKGIHTSRFIKE